MSRWIVEYEPVESPLKNRRGWKFPFQGDAWPTTEDWFWVWGRTAANDLSRYLPPWRAWWDSRKQSFGNKSDDIVAWHKAVVIGGRP